MSKDFDTFVIANKDKTAFLALNHKRDVVTTKNVFSAMKDRKSELDIELRHAIEDLIIEDSWQVISVQFSARF